MGGREDYSKNLTKYYLLSITLRNQNGYLFIFNKKPPVTLEKRRAKFVFNKCSKKTKDNFSKLNKIDRFEASILVTHFC